MIKARRVGNCRYFSRSFCKQLEDLRSFHNATLVGTHVLIYSVSFFGGKRTLEVPQLMYEDHIDVITFF